jgi:hypothetical protein
LVFGFALALLTQGVEGANPGIGYHVAEIPALFLVAEDVKLGEGFGAIGLSATRVGGVTEAGEVEKDSCGTMEGV